jgi:hypothetical protein
VQVARFDLKNAFDPNFSRGSGKAGRQAGRIQPAHNGQTSKRLFFCRHQNAIHN